MSVSQRWLKVFVFEGIGSKTLIPPYRFKYVPCSHKYMHMYCILAYFCSLEGPTTVKIHYYSKLCVLQARLINKSVFARDNSSRTLVLVWKYDLENMTNSRICSNVIVIIRLALAVIIFELKHDWGTFLQFNNVCLIIRYILKKESQRVSWWVLLKFSACPECYISPH